MAAVGLDADRLPVSLSLLAEQAPHYSLLTTYYLLRPIYYFYFYFYFY